MAKKQNLLKNLLTSVSVASIVSSIGGSSGAFAAADVNIGNTHTTLSILHTAGFHGGDNLEFNEALDGGGIVTLTVDAASGAAGNIGNITATNPGNIVIDRNITIGGDILRGGGLGDTMTASINNNTTLTLSAGVDHTGLGAVTLNGATATLTLADNTTVHNAIDGAGVGQGILNLGIGSTVNGEIGGTKSLATVNIAGGEVNINHNVSAANTTLIAGSVLKLAADKTINGTIKNISGVDGKGTLTFLGAGGVTGNIGAAGASLLEVNIGAGEVSLGGNVFATDTKLTAGSVLKLAADKTINGAIKNISGVDGKGTLTFLGAGTVTENIGDVGASLLEVNIGAGEVNLGGNVFAIDTTLTAGSVLKLAADKTINGAIKNISGVDGKGTLTFLGAGGVTGNIGEDTLALAQINIGANAGGEVILGGNVYTKKLEFANASNVKIAGDFGGGANGAAGEVDFGAGGTLTFNGALGDLKTFNATIANGANGTLNVQGRLKATHANIGNIKTINIGTADPAAGFLTIDASAGNVALLNDAAAAAGPGVAINFLDIASELRLLTDGVDSTITFYDHLPGVAGGGGIVSLEGANGHTLTLDSNGAKTLGTAGNTLTRLDVRGQVTIAGRDADRFDIHHVPMLNVIKGAVFTDEGATSAQIATVNIGATGGGGVGAATYVLDAIHGDFNILANVGDQINFSDPDARLILQNSDNTAVLKTITLANTLDPGLVANGKGIVELNSVHNGKMLTITKAAAQSLGTDVNKLKEVKFSGDGDLTIDPTIYAHTITSDIDGTVATNGIDGDVNFTKATILTIRGANNITGNVIFNAAGQLTGNVGGGVTFATAGQLTGNVGGDVTFDAAGRLTGTVTGNAVFNAAGQLTGNVGGNVIFAANGTVDGNVTKVVTVNGGNSTVGGSIGSVAFTGNGQLAANKGVTGEVDFNNHEGTVTVAHQKTIGGDIKKGKNATLVFAGDGEVSGIKELKLLQAGNGNVKLATGDYGITEIQGNGTQTLTFADKFNSTGSINKNGGTAVNLIFDGSSRIDGVVGSDKSPVGNIQIKAGTVAFGDSINAKGDIKILKGATTAISKNFTAKSLTGEGTVRFNNPQELILNIPIETGTIEIAGGNIQATKKISTGNVLFSNSKEAILTLKEESIISNIETTGNGIHSLALNANLTIAAGNVGSKSNRLKEIKLLGNHTISIIGNNFYSNISTANKDSGIVMFNSDDSVAHGNLGTNEFRLSDVTFDSNSTAEGDVYSKKITIKDKKTATFAGTEKKTIDVPGVPRLLEKFTYSTQIGSEEINAEGSSKIQFKSGALVNAPINGGEVILADNVWFKEKVTSAAPVTFAADKYVILEQDVKFASIAANQAKIIMLGEKQTITGDLTAKDLTMDLGTSQVKYGNTAKLTGELKLRSFYDTSKLDGGNIEILSNGKLDLSQLDKLVVTIAGQTDISEMPDETKYVLISSVDCNGVSLDPSKVDLKLDEQSRFVSWTIDPSNLTLHAKDIHKKVIEKDVIELDEESAKTQDPDAASRLSERATLLKLLNNITDKDSDAFKYLGEIGLMDKDNRALAMDKLLPGNTNPISMELALMVSEAISQVASQIASRSVNMLPVASGDDDKVTYGVWGSPFYAVGHQEMRKGISGYRSKSVGGIFGFDGLINDDLLVGVAYSKIDTKMSHKDLKFGDKTNGTTNLFSLYGSYKFPSNFFAEAVASYGITDVKNAEGRVVLDDNKKVTTGTTVAKYKSTSYSGQLLTGYNYQPSEKLTITPTIGLRYSQFMDDGHVQSGTVCQNLTVKKTSYNKFEGILGLRTATNIQLDQLLLIPELHGYVNYDFKGKSPKIDARLGGMNEPLPTKSVKPAKVSFTVGTGLTVKSNMMEYGVTYNAHIADKYIGHQGSLKVKVNF
ncbi:MULTISPECIES: autotransporter domain-containing protein [unclassified Candidatus Tisiphia]|uniref:autotransporter domain-containing protein n=1 Tax=unclassified Candidatus Tisiphia TaxID=2996318 RepID=UPI00312C7D70